MAMGIAPLSMAAGASPSSLRVMQASREVSNVLFRAATSVRPHMNYTTLRRGLTTCADSLVASTTETSGRHAAPHAHPVDVHLEATTSPMHVPQPVPVQMGRMDLIVGPMFAGKSTELLKRVRDELKAGRNTVLVKSSKDTRYTLNHVTTHAGDQLPCTTSERLMPLLADEAFMMHDVIAVDEAQFFPDLLHFVVEAAERHHKSLLVAGLDGDFQRLKFGQMLDLIPLADTITKLSGKCNYCNSKSIHSFRVVADERQELIGGGDKYVPTCRFHYVSLTRHRSAEPN